MAAKKKDEPEVVRTEAAKDAPEGTPLATTQSVGVDPAPDVSNADIDMGRVSLDASASEYIENPDPNPLELRPAPGPSTIQVLGKGDQVDPDRQPGEESR